MADYRSKYTGRYSGIGRLFVKPGVQRKCRDAAVQMMHIAESTSPVGDPEEDTHPGLYQHSFEVRPLFKNVPFKGKPRSRAGARLINTAPHAWRVEKGDGRVPRYAVLQRAMDTMKAAHGA
ncbi:hypothetical protein J7I94_19065 [Streptomyces sp. ISL-12]|uniref:hypothetical protein n=1 Tax=Streptomyces sp. ISL-12 TaxID=2819177 RepID=UPI001BE66FA0|nr:hypothetical protein [Streptomyces sp. ISL-12]MBT2412635.1 hypothetical protein [Streptomyces sp. ISL-12]